MILHSQLDGLTCPAPNCGAVLTQPEIQALVLPETFEKYLHFALLAVVKLDPTTRWCPQPTCSALLSVTALDADSLSCTSCGHQFCPRCSMPPHPARPCGHVLNETEKELSKWAHSLGIKKVKRCPGCRDLVEKNDGCMFPQLFHS